MDDKYRDVSRANCRIAMENNRETRWVARIMEYYLQTRPAPGSLGKKRLLDLRVKHSEAEFKGNKKQTVIR
jgi:hypothetical protein